MRLRGVVFDFDGVIADSESLHLQAYQDVLAETSLRLEKDDYYRRYLGYDDVGVFTTVAKDQGTSLAPAEVQDLIAKKGARFDALVADARLLFPGAAACIERLAAAVPLAIASGALHDEIEEILAREGLRDRFSAIVAADDVPQSKPAPDSYLRAVSLLNSGDPDGSRAFVAIEDSRWGLAAAHAAGLACVGVTNSYPARDLADADLIVPDLSGINVETLNRLCAGG